MPGRPGGSFTSCTTGRESQLRVECAREDGGRATRIESCGLVGRQCVSINPSVSACVGATGKECTVGRRCDGTAAVDCKEVEGVARDLGVECASFGDGRCVSGSAGPTCAPPPDAGTCDAGPGLRCEGLDGSAGTSVVTSCVGGKEIAVDCARQGLNCNPTAPTLPAYDPVGACRLGEGNCGPDECIGDTLKSCGRGRSFEVSCAALGLGPCERPGGGSLAACTAPPPP